MKTIHPGHLEHRFCIFGCQILCITDLAIMPQKSIVKSLDVAPIGVTPPTNMPIDINNDICPFPTSKIIIFTLIQFIYNLGEFCWLLLHVSHQNRQAAKFDAQVLSSALYFTFIEQSWSQVVPVQFLVHRLTAPLLEGYSRVDFIRTQSSTSMRWMLRAGTNYQLPIIIRNSRTWNGE